jgi:hypothetical protein
LVRDMGTAAEILQQIRLDTLLKYRGKFCPKSDSSAKRKDAMSADDIACMLANASPTTLDERIFLVAKLLLVHHFFFPHRPTAASLFSKLTDDLSALYNRHGLSEPPKASPSDKELGELIDAVTHDIAYLIVACDQRALNTLNKREREEVYKKIKQPVQIALGLLCGAYGKNWEGDADFVALTYPEQLNIDLDEYPWPVFRLGQFATWANSPNAEDRAKCFLESLHPEGPIPGRPAERYNNMDVWKRGVDRKFSRRECKEWYVAYARARCTCEFLKE